MRFGAYATAFISACMFSSCIATPVTNDGKLELGARIDPKVASRQERQKNKYFHEPGGNLELGHYDARYFHGIVSDEERTDTQFHMIRAYLQFFRDQGLDTWIAHGTLLGWWWNGKRLPWDFDMDTQVSGATLQYLGENHNQSRHKYTSEDGSVKREYLLDVNPWIWERTRGDGMNIIDARWVDVRNGLFIDITGLSETHPDTKPGVWSCKNYHRYKTSELFPMRETIFEGVLAKVPYAYDKILIDEYKEKALVVTEFENHKWDMEKKEWLKTPEQIEKERKKAEEQGQR
ncbi:hypothetical protein BU24DRAFT_462649 [Aaosphaeria arxii CBS 175.79]|uniref:LicD/FKTN/FKRP nucleotidyltransferase domain-containing protein n=1 Tax=Aaosphaeria arxii CBS 175.79 TaxID=1450172 RepID=A0A6A5XU77_9PLEO|nr:uncharacterized protein BU24DRAFT_462649 [Aaosphaeria arxii CBS 175.79]KAF2016503.1 hypothetical protein BU24DRAFT_462649 [Aaosphaeria arxii CBS 175.79]